MESLAYFSLEPDIGFLAPLRQGWHHSFIWGSSQRTGWTFWHQPHKVFGKPLSCSRLPKADS